MAGAGISDQIAELKEGGNKMDKLKRFIKSDKLTFVFRLLVGGMILYAEAPKLADVYKLSVIGVYKYDFFPMRTGIFGHTINIAQIFGTIGPYLGVLIGLGLIFGVLTRLSAIGWALMCLMFIIMKLTYLASHNWVAIDCGCFAGGPLGHLVMTQTIWIDIFSVPLSLQIALANPERKFMAFWSVLPEKLRNSRLRKIW
jgi:uncharacterized membrane protein YphA (DoxX/SURF4 family)